MSNIIAAVSTTAMVLGFLVLLLLLAGLTWFSAVRFDVWRYNRRRKRQHDLEWDNLRAAWIFDLRKQKTDTEEAELVYYESYSRVDTDVLSEITPEAIINYQRESYRDGP